MQYYNDKSNDNAAKVFFVIFQMLMLLVVYGFGYPVVVWKTLKMFKQGKRLRAIGWMIAWASVIIVALYTHLSQLIVT